MYIVRKVSRSAGRQSNELMEGRTQASCLPPVDVPVQCWFYQNVIYANVAEILSSFLFILSSALFSLQVFIGPLYSIVVIVWKHGPSSCIHLSFSSFPNAMHVI